MKIIAIISTIIALISTTIIFIDLKKNPQQMKIMNSVWVLTALWGSLIALFAYFRFGRNKKKKKPVVNASTNKTHIKINQNPVNTSMQNPNIQIHNNMQEMKTETNSMTMDMHKRPYWQSVTLSTLHCGAGCTLANIIGETLFIFMPFYLGGSLILGSWITDYILALIIGVYFQYIAIQSMQKTNIHNAIKSAIKADIISLSSWQIGMYAWMSIVYFILFNQYTIERLSWEFLFMMQIAMCFGFLFSFPINMLLIHLNIKKRM